MLYVVGLGSGSIENMTKRLLILLKAVALL